MRPLLKLVVVLLLLIVSIFGTASGVLVTNPNTYYYQGQTFPITDSVSQAEANAACVAAGQPGFGSNAYSVVERNSVGNTLYSSNPLYGIDYTSSGDPAVVLIIFNNPCSNGNIVDAKVYYTATYPANFTSSATNGTTPLTVTFTATNATTSLSDMLWSFGDGQTSTLTWTGSDVNTISHTYSASGIFSPSLMSSFGRNNAASTVTRFNYITVSDAVVNTILYFDVLDGSNPSAYVSTVNIGIRNTTSGVWRNSTASNGFIYFDSTGAAYEYPLAVGQTVTLSASANGFETVSRNVTIPYSGYKETFILPRTGTTPTTGGTTYNVMVVWNADGSPLNSAVVRLQTGVNGPCSAGDGCLQYTNENGITVFSNISSSATASITAFAQAAAQQVKIVNSNPNGTVNVNFSLVRTGQIPVTTPVQTPTGAVAPTATTASPYPVITDANGNVVTAADQKGFAAFGLLIDYAYLIMQIAIYCVMIWLLWMIVYILTGGKIIDKIMRRGRGRGR